MAKHGLESLKKLSQSAIPHEDLVNLARNNTPTQTQKKAKYKKWPNRQAKSAYYLAMIQRDFGKKTFNNFIKKGQICPEQSGTDLSPQTGDKSMNKNQNTSIGVNPLERFTMMIKHNQTETEEAKKLLLQIIDSHELSLLKFKNKIKGTIFHPDDDRFSNLTKDIPEINSLNGEDKTITVLLVILSPQENSIVLHLRGMLGFFKWEEDLQKKIIEKILRKSCNKNLYKTEWRELIPIKAVAQTFANENQNILNQIEILFIQYKLRNDLQGLSDYLLENPKDRLNKTVDHLISLGWKMDQVRDEFLEILEYSIKRGFMTEGIIMIAGAKCFKEEKSQVISILHEKYFSWSWKNLLNSQGDRDIRNFCYLIDLGILGNSDEKKEVKKFIRQCFIILLSSGQFNRTWQLILILGHNLNLFWAKGESSRFEKSGKYLKSLIPEALQRAIDQDNLGTAAAFVQNFGEDACFSDDLCREIANVLYDDQFKALEKSHSKEIQLWEDGEDEELLSYSKGRELLETWKNP